jgi:hypothetical protein
VKASSGFTLGLKGASTLVSKFKAINFFVLVLWHNCATQNFHGNDGIVVNFYYIDSLSF